MDKQEKVVCAAIEFTAEHSNSKNRFEYVLCGVGYKEINRLMIRVSCDPVLLSVEGFITNKNRFVDPVEAQKIAIASGQYIDPHKEIERLETAIDGHWFNVEHAKSQAVISSLKTYIRQDTARLEELKSSYLGDSLRVEDLY